MSDCANQNGYDAIMLRIDFEGDEQPWTYPLALNGRVMERVTIGGERYERVRECENQYKHDVYSFECSKCCCDVSGGDEYGHNSTHGRFRYCPNCGAKVVSA